MGSQQVLIRELVVPKMSLAHVRETLPFRVQDLLPLPVEDAVLDFFPIEEVDADGSRALRGLLVAATRDRCSRTRWPPRPPGCTRSTST